MTDMSEWPIKRMLMVKGRPTEVMTVGPTIGEHPKNIVLVIPGNPGLVTFYERFMECLYKKLGGSCAIWAISHAGHCNTKTGFYLPDSTHIYNLQDQIAHKIDFIMEYLPRGAKVTLVGHSIGCKVILDVLNKLEESGASHISIEKSYLLFPTIERMKETPNGVKMWPFICYMRWFIVLLSIFLTIIPQKIKETLIMWYFKGRNIHSCCIKASMEFVTPDVVWNVLYMAYHELVEVREPDLETLAKRRNEIVLYYGLTDQWCPKSYWENLVNRIEGIDAHLCQRSYAHAFVLTSSDGVAELVSDWIKMTKSK